MPPTAPPPSSPQSSPTSKPSARRAKLRTKGGLVQGTGRLRPNGTIRRSDSKPKVQPPTKAPVRLTHTSSIDSDSSSSSSTSSESSSSSAASTSSQQDLSHLDPSIIKMAEMYNFPFLPAPLPNDEEDDRDYSVYYGEYTSGVMMASKRIRDFCPKRPKHTGNYPPPPEPERHIPGWTDGTTGWRDSVYSMRAPKASEDPSRYNSPPKPPCTLRRSNSSSTSSHMPPYGPKILSNEEMLANYAASFRRPGAHPPASPVSPKSPASSRSTSSTRRERSLVHPKAEGKLLVPDVKMKVPCRSSSSLSTLASPRPTIRSPLSMCVEDKPKRPSTETRSWSYDNVKTYDIMPIKRNIIKRKEKQIIDGEEVEVEVEIVEPLKRLFLFPNPSGC